MLTLLISAGCLAVDDPATIAGWLEMDKDSVETSGAAVLVVGFLLIPGELVKQKVEACVATYVGSKRGFSSFVVNRIRGQLAIIDANRKRYVLVAPLLGGALAIHLYVTTYYLNIPQVLGGAKPRCAALDVRVGELSTSTARSLHLLSSSGNTTLRTTEVEVYFAGSDTILVGVPVAVSGRREVIELRRDSVAAIKWCDEPGA